MNKLQLIVLTTSLFLSLSSFSGIQCPAPTSLSFECVNGKAEYHGDTWHIYGTAPSCTSNFTLDDQNVSAASDKASRNKCSNVHQGALRPVEYLQCTYYTPSEQGGNQVTLSKIGNMKACQCSNQWSYHEGQPYPWRCTEQKICKLEDCTKSP